jgi:hypothetical protein
MFVYGNWSAYDELSDGIELTEKLAMHQFQELLRLRSHGVQFDAYLMDAFWFAPEGGYREWRKPHWPNGPDGWLEACREHEVLPGLWFTVNTLCHLSAVSRWEDSVDAKYWGMCLFSGGFMDDFMEVLDHWYQRGIRVFKFDFADLAAVPAAMKDVPSPDEVRRRNIEELRSRLSEFRSRHPEAILMGFNGFDESYCMERTDRPFGKFIDPDWLDVFDSLYCGDPRPADVPDLDFWRSVDLYSDHMTRAFHESGLPLDRIDNCGFMAGPTGTCYWRGKQGWKRMLLLSLARGGRFHVAYGDLSLFSNDDACWWARAQTLFVPSMAEGKTTFFGGVPGKAEPYGWRSMGSAEEIVTIVNPRMTPDRISLPRQADWSIVTQDPGFEIELTPHSAKLGPGQMAILSSGAKSADLDMADTTAIVATGPVIYPLEITKTDRYTEFLFSQVVPGEVVLIVSQVDANGEAVRTYPTPDGHSAFAVEIAFDGQSLSLGEQPDRVVWSGMSWASFRLPRSTEGRNVVARVRSFSRVAVNLRAQMIRMEIIELSTI